MPLMEIVEDLIALHMYEELALREPKNQKIEKEKNRLESVLRGRIAAAGGKKRVEEWTRENMPELAEKLKWAWS